MPGGYSRAIAARIALNATAVSTVDDAVVVRVDADHSRC